MMTRPPTPESRQERQNDDLPFDRAWTVVIAGFVILFFATGVSFYSFAAFVEPLCQEMGWSRLAVSTAAGLWALAFGLGCPLAGLLIDRWGERLVMSLAATITGAGYLLLGRTVNLSMFIALMTLLGTTAACCSVTPVQTVVSRWFPNKRGMALGLVLLGIGLGGMVSPAVATWVVRHWGWRNAFALGGILMWLIVLPATLLGIKNAPKQMSPLARSSATEKADSSITLRQALRKSAFWQLFGAQLALMLATVPLGVHIIAVASEMGIASQTAGNLFGASIGISMLGRVVGGLTADRFSAKWTFVTASILLALATACICAGHLLTEAALLLMVVFVLCYGLGLGGAVVALPVVVSRCFGLRYYGSILGAVLSGFGPGAILGTVIVGGLYDLTGWYFEAMIACTASFTLAAVLTAGTSENVCQAGSAS